MTSTTEHVSVMRDRCVDLLSPAIIATSNPVVVDATLGLGGHTEALLQKFPHLTVIGIDRDLDAIAKDRSETLQSIEKALVDLYEKVRETTGGAGAAALVGGAAPAPRMIASQIMGQP